MSAPLARRDFFALEAGEYLERLSVIVAGTEAPDVEHLVRYTRALRGAALMAGPPGYAVAAAAMENVAKALREGAVGWSPALAARLSDALETGKLLLRRSREWGEEDIARCERTATDLNDLVGGSPRRPSGSGAHPAPTQSAAVRAYIARETAALAATLEQAADGLERFDPEASGGALRRLQPLRGLGTLPGLSPLPELLEALDLTLAFGAKSGSWPPGAARALRAASAALVRIARDIAELGLSKSDSPELTQAAESLREAFAGDQDVVPVASLFGDRDADPIIRLGSPPSPPEPPADLAVELVTLADRLRHAAAQLRTGPAGPARAFQLHAVVLALRGLVMSEPVSATAGNFFCRLDRETMAGHVLPAAEPVAALLERASRALADAAETGATGNLAAMLAPLCEELDALVPEPESEIVPIESLAPEPEIVTIESLAPSFTAFEQTFSTWFRLEQKPAPRVAPATPAGEPEPVPIQEMLFRGRRALERADQVRRELRGALEAQAGLTGIENLLGELLDLVPLALDDER
jgi:hypothetical protein